MLYLVAMIMMAAGTVPASAQSFDCDNADLQTELAICQNSELGALDEEMAALYFGLPEDLRLDIRASQVEWLRERNACGVNYECIESALRERINFLSEL